MTIHDLRKIICVGVFHNDYTGCKINYTINNKPELLTIVTEDLFLELKHMSSIERPEELFEGYKLSQWDALNLVIRHEYKLYTQSDIDDSDIGKAINKLKL